MIEAVKAMEEGVIESVADGNIGSIMGIGFPPHVGGIVPVHQPLGREGIHQTRQRVVEKIRQAFRTTEIAEGKSEEKRKVHLKK